MKHALTTFLALVFCARLIAAQWTLDARKDETLIAHGDVQEAPGVNQQSLVLDGASVIELKDSAALKGGAGFTFSVWFNPYDLPGGYQQMLAGKNRYSLNQRQWSLTIEPDGKLKAHLWQSGWSTISCAEPLKPGAWHFATLVVEADKAALFLNGKPMGVVKLKQPIAATEAPITLGGIWDAEKLRQAFHGALDECSFQPRAMNAEEIAASYRPVLATLPAAAWPLWDESRPLPKAAELPQVAGAEFHVIKKPRPDTDGCNFSLGVALAWYKGRLYASYGFSTGTEFTATEQPHVRVSDDGGKTWGSSVAMGRAEGNRVVSHGAFLSHAGRLWAFMGSFTSPPWSNVQTHAYELNESTGVWEPHGVVLEGGFWPMQEPQKMADGNWIMPGLHVAATTSQADKPVSKSDYYNYAVKTSTSQNQPAVAISKGDNFTKWEQVVIPPACGLGNNVWGESAIIVEGKRILNISRYGTKAVALLAVSEDYGRTWTPTAPSNLLMATSKPCVGILSTGQRFLVCTTTADTGARRSPLTIAVSKPGESVFSKVFLIRTSVFEGTPGVSAANADFSYPYAVEHEGKLYIGYTHKSHAAHELAVIPVRSLEIKP
jgi:hypothetical protein